MKVLHVIPSVSPLRGGPSEAVLQMVQALHTKGVDAEIVTTNDHGDEVLDLPLYVQQDYPRHAPVPIRFFPRFSPPIHSIREYAFSGSLASWLWQHIAEYDLIHIHAIFSWASTVAMAIARCKNIPYLVRPLGQLCHWSLQQGQRKKQLYLSLIERANLNGAKLIHFTSEQEQLEAREVGLQAPSFVLPHGLVMPPLLRDAKLRLCQSLDLPQDEPIILFLSRLHPKKGLDFLITALSDLQNHRFTFILAGNAAPDYEQEVQQLLERTGLAGRTRRLGFVTGDTKNLLLQGSDLFVLTSQSENFGIAVLEAMASGLPSLISSGVALASIVEQFDLGWVVPLEHSAIASSLQDFLNAPLLAKRMGERAQQIVHQKYTWNPIVTELIEHYEYVLSAERPGKASITPWSTLH